MDPTSPEYLRRTDQLRKIIRATIDRLDSDPIIVLPVLFDMACLYLVTEYHHEPWHVVQQKAHEMLAAKMSTTKDMMDRSLGLLRSDNDGQ